MYNLILGYSKKNVNSPQTKLEQTNVTLDTFISKYLRCMGKYLRT